MLINSDEELPPVLKEEMMCAGWDDPITPGAASVSSWMQGARSLYQIELASEVDPPLLTCTVRTTFAHGGGRRRALCDVVNRANLQLLMGHVELSFANDELRYRIAIPLHECTATHDTAELLAYFGTGRLDHYLPAFEAVSRGELTPGRAIAALEGGHGE